MRRLSSTDPAEIEPQLWSGFKGEVGWDIGANCGQSKAEMIGRFFDVYAFEPAEECFEYLRQAEDKDYRWYPVAVSDNDETINLIELPSKIDTGQLVSADAKGMEYDPASPDGRQRVVTCRSVDSLIADWNLPAPDFMKIDVEGHEFKVLVGARRTLAVKRPDILLEFHSPVLYAQCAGMLDSYGYQVETVRHPHYETYSGLWHAHGWLRATQSPADR